MFLMLYPKYINLQLMYRLIYHLYNMLVVSTENFIYLNNLQFLTARFPIFIVNHIII